ncbi:EPIDERMAL PATTERNING FACTOR-like protein 3 [Cucurbita pepo subsp. pepo]|uniref:EPIDERMAL PATTERNING FACTOR-like protein 3 n=1 Tax=Cucurbita pepo subsp. pepo TaxID=3664 RepID=UPI000C9D4AAB|nr:EPIDERMAL PATTERNING FACTOR-like protein 3 [Cucurbita pepo subsp. pepo]
MKGTYYCFMFILHLACWVPAKTTAFAPNHPLLPHKQQRLLPALVSAASNSKQGVGGVNEEEMLYRGMRRMGSGRPRCEHKCYGCSPCEAIEVPTNNNNNNKKRRTHVGVQYTNYEPEGWKCKCGHSFYTP